MSAYESENRATQILKRGKQSDCRCEPAFAGHRTVCFAWAADDLCLHNPSGRCAIEAPHRIDECGEFDRSGAYESENRATPAQKSALARCDREIAEARAEMLAGNPDVEGLGQALGDWTRERQLIEAEMAKTD